MRQLTTHLQQYMRRVYALHGGSSAHTSSSQIATASTSPASKRLCAVKFSKDRLHVLDHISYACCADWSAPCSAPRTTKPTRKICMHGCRTHTSMSGGLLTSILSSRTCIYRTTHACQVIKSTIASTSRSTIIH